MASGQPTVSRALTRALTGDVFDRTFLNWGKSVTITPAVRVIAKSVKEVQAICRDEKYPSPLRASGAALSVTACHCNCGGTTIAMHQLTAITGLYDMVGPRGEHGEATRVRCVEVQAGVTLAQLQRFLDGHGLEISFCAEIGSATVGGVCFATTKDSSIGALCPSGGLGDFQSCLMAIGMVDKDGQLQERRLFNENGSENTDFQVLLSSEGTQGIAVSMSIAVRPAIPTLTTLHLKNSCDGLAEWLRGLHEDASVGGGNIFAMLNLKKGLVLVESRRPAKPEEVKNSLFNERLKAIYVKIKKNCFQRGRFSQLMKALLPASAAGVPLQFSHPRRLSNFEYPKDMPLTTERLVFSYYSFDMKNLEDVVHDGLSFCSNWHGKTGFSPNGFAIYFVTSSGKRTAGPYAKRGASTSFSFDPIYNDPCDPSWVEFVREFNVWAKLKGGIPALNQTLEIEKMPHWGAQCVDGKPDPRFTSEWMKAFFDAKQCSSDSSMIRTGSGSSVS